MFSSDGPLIWANWRQFRKGLPAQEILEGAFYSDAHLWPFGSASFGPYTLYFVPTWGDVSNPPIHVRLARYIPAHPNDAALDALRQTDTSRYHGGWIEDEMAALLSLCLRIRVAYARTTRRIQPSGDPYGVPILEDYRPSPQFRFDSGRAVIPRACSAQEHLDVRILETIPSLSGSAATSLIKAARQYQQALLVAETEPHLSWLLFVSAIETAAGQWNGERVAPVDQLRASKPKLVELLEQAGGDDLMAQVAEILADQLGATRKFISFLLHFLPDPPEERPDPQLQHVWTEKAFKKSFTQIYSYRSRALHAGTPFPDPMSNGIWLHHKGVPGEVFSGQAFGSHNATWLREDLPLQLHTFEYIVQAALIRWWRSMAV